MKEVKLGTVFGITTPSGVRIAKLRKKEVILKRGQFVKLLLPERTPLLGRIQKIWTTNLLLTESLIPDYGDADVDNIEQLGIPRDVTEQVFADVEIIGIRSGKRFVRPRMPVRPGDFVYMADDDFMAALFTSENAISIGMLRDNPKVVAYIDYQELISKHFAVLAMTGGGKSYLAGVLIEELANRFSLPIIVLDPHGEYSSMKIKRVESQEAQRVSSRIRVYVPGRVTEKSEEYFMRKFGVKRTPIPLRFHPGEFERYQVVELVRAYYGLSQAQARLLEKSWDDVAMAYEAGGILREQDIMEVIHAKVEGRGEEIAFQTLKTKLGMLFRKKYLHFGTSTVVDDFVAINRISVIDLGGMDIVDQQVVAALLATITFKARKAGEVPPVLLVIEEAHRFIPPSTRSSASGHTFKRIAAEGRKFLLGLGVVSQRPSRLDSDVLSQCNTQIILRLMNPNDQKYVKDVSEGITKEDLEEIRGLSQGEAYVFGAGVPLPLPVKIRQRWTQDGGFTPKLEEELALYESIDQV